MLITTRRSLLKAAVGSACVLSGSAQTARQKLVVVFHGTFAFSFDPTQPEIGLTIVAPHVDLHLYKAGNFREEQRLEEGRYHLLGAIPGNAPTPSSSHFAVVHRKNTGDPGQGKITIGMPWPNKFRGLREVAARETDFFEDGITKIQNGVRPTHLPLVYVAMYLYRSTPSLVDSTSNAKWMYSNRNLHIFAEPDRDTGVDHADDSLRQLNSLFSKPLDLKMQDHDDRLLDRRDPEPDPDHEVSPDEQQSLADRGDYPRATAKASVKHVPGGKQPGEPFFTRIRNCQSLVVVTP